MAINAEVNDDADDTDDEDGKKSGTKPGCLLITSIAAIAVLGGGTYLMTRWEEIPGIGKAGAVILIVLGTLLLLPVLLMVALKVFLHVFVGKIKKELSSLGDGILGDTRQMYETIHEFRDADEDDFHDLDRNFYDTNKAHLEGRGFRLLGDVVDETIEELQDMTVPIRVMVSGDGTTVVGFYHLPIEAPNMPGQRLLVYDFSTEFTDGEFLMASNTAETDLMTPPPTFHSHKHPLGTSVDEMLAAHDTRKQELIAQKSAAGVQCVIIHTLDEALEAERRQQMAKNTHRAGIGYVDPDEVRRIAATMNDDQDGRIGDIAARATEQAKERQQE